MLTMLAKARAHQTPAQQRAAMVADIRADIRSNDPAADTPALARALTAIGTIPREDFVDARGRARRPMSTCRRTSATARRFPIPMSSR